MEDQLSKFLSEVEWYDNSTLEVFLNCRRKYFWKKLSSKSGGSDGKGLDGGVGHGAFFGTCIHKALEIYYNNWGNENLEQRRVLAIDAFCDKYKKIFGNSEVQSKHLMENGISILDHYFLTFVQEDSCWEPIDNELATLVRIEPSIGEDFEPFWYIARSDGLWRSKTNGTLWVKETKTGIDQPTTRIKFLKLARQTRGYVWSCRQFLEGTDPLQIRGVLADCIQVAVQKRDCGRDMIPVTIEEAESWRKQTINIVQQIRQSKALSEQEGWKDSYYMNDKHCSAYGICAFYDLCYYGPHLASQIAKNTWTPFKKED